MVLIPIMAKRTELMYTIRSLREEMIRIGIQEGLTSEKTIKLSQKLDFYISKYQAIHLNKEIFDWN